MNKNILVTLKEFLVTQLNHFNLYIIALTITVIADNSIHCGRLNPFMWFVIGLIPLLFYFARKYVKRFWVFILIHIFMLLLMLILPTPHIVFRVVNFLCVLGYCIHSICLSFEHKNIHNGMIIPPVTVVISFLTLCTLSYLKLEGWTQYYLFLTILIICVYFIVYYMDHYLKFITVNEHSTGHIPQKAILFSGLKLLLSYMFIGMIILMITANFTWLESILAPIKNFFMGVLRKLFSWLPQKTGNIEEQPDLSLLEDMSEIMPLPPEETFWLWEVLEKLLGIIVICLLAYFILKGFFKLITYIHDKVKLNGYVDNTVSDKVYDIREKCDMIRKDKKRSKDIFAKLTYEERIRKSFKKKLKASKHLICEKGDESALSYYTARECADTLENPRLGALYEKARYSNIPCDKSDVSAMKEACK